MNYPNNPRELDWGSMSKTEFKRAELHYELRHEDTRLQTIFVVYIDSKRWKEFYKLESAQKAANTIKNKYNKQTEIRTFTR